jgi:hypothetical protein
MLGQCKNVHLGILKATEPSKILENPEISLI